MGVARGTETPPVVHTTPRAHRLPTDKYIFPYEQPDTRNAKESDNNLDKDGIRNARGGECYAGTKKGPLARKPARASKQC